MAARARLLQDKAVGTLRLRQAEALRLAETVEALLAAEGRQAQQQEEEEEEEGKGSGVEDDLTVLRVIAHHNCCVCHEHLKRHSLAMQEARRALRLAEKLVARVRRETQGGEASPPLASAPLAAPPLPASGSRRRGKMALGRCWCSRHLAGALACVL